MEILHAKMRSLEAVEASLKQTRQEAELLKAELGTSFKDTDHGTRLKELTQEIEKSKAAWLSATMASPERLLNLLSCIVTDALI